jgi:hypothetical protein
MKVYFFDCKKYNIGEYNHRKIYKFGEYNHRKIYKFGE